ncbi:MAG: molybdopterin-dependent oxidoreductase [Fimbriiglobus sp.]|jgi:NADH-quinone oxidoreductase subunit G|nr:molybdopterin-dependent oxidoreductase [Fimbriiglobus sp.]
MPTVYVNDTPVEIGTKKLNCVQAAELAGVLVPHYCYHPGLSVVASCRMCLVEMGELKDGKVTMQPKVFPGCQTPVKDGSVIVTGEYATKRANTPLAYDPAYKPGDRAKKAQADTLEGLLLNHPLDCPVCDKAGECKLQDYSYQFGRTESRLVDEKNQPPNKPELSSKITLFTDRCIMCTRCVRFTREISGTAELQVVGRGHHEEIDVFPGFPLENKLSGNVVDLCPVGALGSKDFLYTQRVWYLKTTDNVCGNCSTGCSVHTDTNKDIVYRLRARENLDAQGYFICDEGRWGYHYAQSPDRIIRTYTKAADGKLKAAPLGPAFPSMLKKLVEDALYVTGKKAVVVLSPFLTVEEAFALGTAFKGINKDVRLVLGPVPVVGEDDHYPKNAKGEHVPPAKFTIHAEKCPNRHGVEAVLKQLQGELIRFTDVTHHDLNFLWFAGGYREPKWVDMAIPDGWKAPPTLIVQDHFASKLTAAATVVLPATTPFEKEGTFVNHAGYVQPFPRAVKPGTEVRSELQVAFDMAGKKGLATVAPVRDELAKQFPQFAALAELKTTANKKVALATV